jgi:hypothetical protein
MLKYFPGEWAADPETLILFKVRKKGCQENFLTQFSLYQTL